MISQILLVGIIIGILYSRNVMLASVALAMAPIVVFIALGFRRIARETTRKNQRSTAMVNTSVFTSYRHKTS